MRVVFFGECMLELTGPALGSMQQHYGGDTFNTALYLRRCVSGELPIRYATAVGDDALSVALLRCWAADGLQLDLVRTVPGRLPGLYQISVDTHGERSFSFWREHSAARAYFDANHTPLEQRCDEWDVLYFSGISLAILPPAGRERLLRLAHLLRQRGAMVVFDNNFRPALWPDLQVARDAFHAALALASVALVTADDHQALFGYGNRLAAVAAAQSLQVPELIIKQGAQDTLVRSDDTNWQHIPTESVAQVVDTTAAGDSFAAGYLSQRLAGASAAVAAAFGNRLAARVISHHGAIIAAAAMADLMPQPPQNPCP